MTAYHELRRQMRLPVVPTAVMNCTTPPPMTLPHADDLGVALGDAMRSFDGPLRIEEV